MAIKRVTRRWLLNNFAVIVLLIILAVVFAGYAVMGYHYESVRQTLMTRIDVAASVVTQYVSEADEIDLNARMQNFVASFPQRSSMELMTVGSGGEIALTSSGFEPDDKSLPDYERALDSRDSSGTGYWVGNLGAERVMAVTMLLSSAGTAPYSDAPSAVRLVTSLEQVDQRIAYFIAAIFLLGVVVLLLILFSSSYFINSIVNPVGQIGDTARRIAGGDFAARLDKKSADEIGELCDIINHMAEELAAAEMMKNDFISSVSHELRTPLTAIQGWAETLLADGGRSRSVLEKGMSVIISETTRLSSMVEELLDFSHMQSGRLKLVLTTTDAVAELSEAFMMYEEKAKRERIGLSIEGEQTVAPVYGDKNKLRQVFVNVLDNAIKYSDAGGSVRVSVLADQDILTITVSDNGVGIRAEDLPNIKLKFFKASSARRGSGIGLAVADEVITRHGGTLTLESDYGEGTTVTIKLPVYKGSGELAQIQVAQQIEIRD